MAVSRNLDTRVCFGTTGRFAKWDLNPRRMRLVGGASLGFPSVPCIRSGIRETKNPLIRCGLSGSGKGDDLTSSSLGVH